MCERREKWVLGEEAPAPAEGSGCGHRGGDWQLPPRTRGCDQPLSRAIRAQGRFVAPTYVLAIRLSSFLTQGASGFTHTFPVGFNWILEGMESL